MGRISTLSEDACAFNGGRIVPLLLEMSEIDPLQRSITLESLTWDNLGDMLVHRFESSSEFYELPQTDHQIDRHMDVVANNHRNKFGFWYNAYDNITQRFIGGAQFYVLPHSAVATIGYWVVKAHRQQHYGSALLAKVENEVVDRFPNIERIELHIDRRNLGSLALAHSMGYELLHPHEDGEKDVLWKVPA